MPADVAEPEGSEYVSYGEAPSYGATKGGGGVPKWTCDARGTACELSYWSLWRSCGILLLDPSYLGLSCTERRFLPHVTAIWLVGGSLAAP